MFSGMTHGAKPHNIELEGVSAMVMSLWFAFLAAFGAFSWPYKLTDAHCIVDSILSFKFLRVLSPCSALFLQDRFWMTQRSAFSLFENSFRMKEFVSLVILSPFFWISFSPFPLRFSTLWHGLILPEST